MVTATRKASRAMTALRDTVLPHLEPMVSVETPLSCTPATPASSLRMRVTSAAGSSSVWTLTWMGWVSVIWTISAAEPTASRTWASVTGLVGWTRNTAPPLKSMPKLRPGTIKLTSEMTTSAPEIANHRRRRPMMSKLVSPWYRRLARDTDGILLGGQTAARMPTKRPSWNRRVRVSRETAGRAKNQAAKKSIRVARPRVKAKPRTGPMAKMYSSRAARNDTELAETRVWNERCQPRSTEVRRVLPSRTSSFSRSKNTT